MARNEAISSHANKQPVIIKMPSKPQDLKPRGALTLHRSVPQMWDRSSLTERHGEERSHLFTCKSTTRNY